MLPLARSLVHILYLKLIALNDDETPCGGVRNCGGPASSAFAIQEPTQGGRGLGPQGTTAPLGAALQPRHKILFSGATGRFKFRH